eukprot:s2557_g12.t1
MYAGSVLLRFIASCDNQKRYLFIYTDGNTRAVPIVPLTCRQDRSAAQAFADAARLSSSDVSWKRDAPPAADAEEHAESQPKIWAKNIPEHNRPSGPSQVWEDIVQAALCWTDVIDAEVFIAVNVFSMLSWVPMCAFRSCHMLTAQAFEHWAAHPQQRIALSWVRTPQEWQSDCLRFIGQHCRNVRQLVVRDTAHFGERELLRLVCGMRLLEALQVDGSSFGAGFPDPERLFGRLAKYCPRLQHIAMSFRPDMPSQRVVFEVRSLACLGRRLLTLDLGAVAVRIFGGSCTIATCCPQLQRLSVQLHQQFQPDVVDPNDIAQGCPIQDMDLAPVDWSDLILENFVTQAPNLRRLVLRHVAPHATAMFLVPLVAISRSLEASGLLHLHLALHARSDPVRAAEWLQAISHLRLRSLCLDYAAPLLLTEVISAILGDGGMDGTLTSLTIHGCHSVNDEALEELTADRLPLRGLALSSQNPMEAGMHRGLVRSSISIAGRAKQIPFAFQ